MASELPPSHQDPDNPYRTLEVCGRIESMDADTDATFYRALQKRYGLDVPVFDADIRVVIVVEPTAFIPVSGDSPTPETVALTKALEQLASDESSAE